MAPGEIKISEKLRIMRTWEEKDINTGRLYNYYMILMDPTGDQILCQLTPTQFDMHKDKLIDQNVISLQFFKLMASSKCYRPLPSDIRLFFNAFTRVKLKTEETEDIPTYRFIFTDLDDMDQLQKRCGRTTYTTCNIIIHT
ncbi:hypothetical protein MKX03_014257 [Papaver bracteatum]|nr:hypothetical protein MKX03_014257 [Papaver bracteatum]